VLAALPAMLSALAGFLGLLSGSFLAALAALAGLLGLLARLRFLRVRVIHRETPVSPRNDSNGKGQRRFRIIIKVPLFDTSKYIRNRSPGGLWSPSGTHERRPHAFEADVVAGLAHDTGSAGVFSKPRAMRLGTSRRVLLVLRRPRDYAAGIVAGDTGMDTDKPRQHGWRWKQRG